VTVQRRLVTVAAVVVTEETQGPEDVAVSYAAVAEALRSHVARTLAGEGRHLLPIEYPLVRFEARSEPVPGEEAAALSVTGLREMLDEATRVMHDLAADGLTLLRVRQIRNRAGLEEL
jgi:hypothetical protein